MFLKKYGVDNLEVHTLVEEFTGMTYESRRDLYKRVKTEKGIK